MKPNGLKEMMEMAQLIDKNEVAPSPTGKIGSSDLVVSNKLGGSTIGSARTIYFSATRSDLSRNIEGGGKTSKESTTNGGFCRLSDTELKRKKEKGYVTGAMKNFLMGIDAKQKSYKC